MDNDILKNLSPSAQKMLRGLAGTPGDAANLINRAQIFRGLLLLGIEVMEKSGDPHAQAGATFARASVVALECAMTVIEETHKGAFDKVKLDGSATPFTMPDADGIRKLDLDP